MQSMRGITAGLHTPFGSIAKINEHVGGEPNSL
jgi:hypothetical protein